MCSSDFSRRVISASIRHDRYRGNSMRITQVEAIPVRVPLKAGMVTKTAHGDHHTSDYVIVRVAHR